MTLWTLCDTMVVMNVDVILIRRSPVVSVLKLLLSISLISIIYSTLVMGMDITESPFFSGETIIAYDVLFFCIYTFIILFLTFFVMLRWSCDTFEIREGEIIHKFGIFRKSHQHYSLSNTENITLNQGILGRLFQYGTISIYNPLQKTEIHVTRIVDPASQLTLIQQAILGRNGDKKIVPMSS